MNRLWVRLSLSFTAVMVSVFLIVGVSVRLSNQPSPEVVDWTAYKLSDAEIEALEFLRTHRVYERIDEQMSRRALPIALSYIAAVTGVAAIIAGALVSRHMTKPLSRLQEGAQAIGENQLTYRVEVAGTEEMRQVAQTFNQMAATLEQEELLRRKLLSDVAHELRNPLHVIEGNLRAMLDGVYAMDEVEIARLLDQTRHLTALVTDLHVLAQAEAKELPLHKQPIDIGALVKETAVSFRSTAAAKEVQLQVELLGAMPIILVDADRIRQIVDNLLTNGLRHTGKNGRILVSIEQVGDIVQIKVEDSGSGIAADDLPYLFDRFYRTDAARRRDKGGAGLGLAIVQAIAEAHEGGVTAVSSGIGQGSTFTLWLPL